jgi:protein gp37
VAETSIEWATRVWNPVVGCTAVSPGCENCYAEKLATRHVLMSAARGTRSPYLRVVDTEHRRWTRSRDAAATPDTHRRVELLPERLLPALKYKAGDLVFAVSMGDPFHADVPFEFVEQMWTVMASSPATFQILTKRPGQMLEFLRWLRERAIWNIERVDVGGQSLPGPALWPDALPNVWLGTSVEDQLRADARIPELLQCPAAVRFISAEPLLGPLRLYHVGQTRDGGAGPATFRWIDALRGGEVTQVDDGGPAVRGGGGPRLDWVIVGGESGPGARPMDEGWARSLRDQCELAGVAFFFKQWGGVNKKKSGRVLDGRTHDVMPEVRRAT